jgi:hypothetical protein
VQVRKRYAQSPIAKPRVFVKLTLLLRRQVPILPPAMWISKLESLAFHLASNDRQTNSTNSPAIIHTMHLQKNFSCAFDALIHRRVAAGSRRTIRLPILKHSDGMPQTGDRLL